MTTWIFQGNPKDFQVDEYLRTRRDIVWAIRQEHLIEDISIDDVIYIWRSVGDNPHSGGIVAKGKIKSLPSTDISEDAPELWLEEEPKQFSRVKIYLEDVRLTGVKGMINRDYILEDPILSNLLIIGNPIMTNYKLTKEHTEKINQWWKKNDKNNNQTR
jgi:5-methylcytosine-specific restriction enzyme A